MVLLRDIQRIRSSWRDNNTLLGFCCLREQLFLVLFFQGFNLNVLLQNNIRQLLDFHLQNIDFIWRFYQTLLLTCWGVFLISCLSRLKRTKIWKAQFLLLLICVFLQWNMTLFWLMCVVQFLFYFLVFYFYLVNFLGLGGRWFKQTHI